MKHFYSILILHDGVLQAQALEVLLCRLAEMSLTLHIHRTHSQSGSDVREIYPKAACQVYKLYFFRKIFLTSFVFYFINIIF